MKFPLSVVFVLVATQTPVFADPPVPQQLRTDPDGDPLPDGAVARFGSARWRVSTEGRKLTLSPDGKVLLVTTDTFYTECLDVKTGRRQKILGTPLYLWGVDITPPVAFSADAKQVATSYYDDPESYISVRRWSDDKELQQIKFKKKAKGYEPARPPELVDKPLSGGSTSYEHLTAVAFSPDGKTLAAAGRYSYQFRTTKKEWMDHLLFEVDDNAVGLWDLASGKQLRELTGHNKEIHTVAFSADGKTLTTASKDGTVRFWNTETGQAREKAWKAGGPIYTAAHSPDRKQFAAGSEKVVMVWDANTGRVQHKLEMPSAQVLSVAFSPDGKTLAAAGGDTVRLWTAASGNTISDLQPAPMSVRSIVFAADGKALFSIHENEQRVRRWDVATRRPLPEPEGHSGPVRFLTFTPEGKQLVSFAIGDGFKLSNVSGGTIEAIKDDDPRVMAAMLAASGRTRPVLCEDAFASGFALLLGKAHRLEQIPGLLGCSVDGKRVLCGSNNKDKKPVLTVTEVGIKKELLEIACENGEETNATLSPGGETVATAAGGELCFIDVATKERRRYKLATKKAEPGDLFFACSAVKFSSDATRVVVLGGQGVLRVVAVADGHLIREIDTAEKNTSGVAFSPDGKTLLTTVSLGGVSVWEVATGRCVRSEPAGSYLFAPGNRVLASNTEHGLRLCDLYTGGVLRECKLAEAEAANFTFSPDGHLLAAGYSDCTVVLWDVLKRAKPEKAVDLDAKRLEQLWSDLEKGDATRAYAAIGVLLTDPERSTRFLAQRLRPAEAAEKNRNEPSPMELSHDRAIQVLERIGTKDALQVLDRLTRGAKGAATTTAAREALLRTPIGR